MCKAIREGDEMACSCGMRWGIDEVDPHAELERVRKELTEQGAHVTDDNGELSHILGVDPANKDGDRSVINGHILYRPSDFTDEESLKSLGIAVIDGGLNVCMICGEYESGLNEKCKGTK